MTQRQGSAAASVGEKAAEANTNKAARQGVQEKTAQELLRRESHQFLFTVMRIVFPAERHVAIGYTRDAVVGDSDTVGVAGQVLENVLRSAKGSLSVNYPILTKQGAQESMERFCFTLVLQAARKQQLAVLKGVPQASYELAAKDTAQNLNRQEESVARVNPTLAIRR